MANKPALSPGEAQALQKRIRELQARNQQRADVDLVDDLYASVLTHTAHRVRWLLYAVLCLLCAAIAWAAWAELEEVTSAPGKVIPSSREQVLQSLEAGILAEILVSEGQLVEQDQALLRIDDVKQGAGVQEVRGRVNALRAVAVRLHAEARDVPAVFPDDLVRAAPDAVANERRTFDTRRAALQVGLSAQEQTLKLAQEELRITEPLAAQGMVSDVEILRIRRTIAEARGRMAEMTGKFRADAASEVSRVESELAIQQAGLTSREDSFRRTVLRAPKRGIIKNISVNTVGGVVQSGQALLEIVPVDDKLLIEARVRPADIAFLRPGLNAVVKLTAYDATQYGWLTGSVVQISPDTLQDEVRRDETYYRVVVKTDHAALSSPAGQRLPIIPGMVAQVDIKTGQKSVLSYLFKPVLKAREALRER
jgi:adhesin transport system membrane fusion protein